MTKILALTMAVSLAALCFTPKASAQTVTNSAQTFLTSAENYLTSFDTNYCWTNVTLQVDTGYKQVTGVGAASYLTAQYDIGTWNVGADLQFSGVGSPINSAQVQGGYALLEHYDAKLDVDLAAGYDWGQRAAVVEPIVSIEKKLTSNTYARIGVSLPYFVGKTFNQNPTFWAGVGFTY